ncbi:hypothetical protein XENORESO_021828 [Xenotaenia resolanae]|uniref:NADH dehydrogenase subunit 5 n=1 Tax=Xenotaenia resolanae TaxID=208358 RepID=A0ABV0XA03_9TELE
MATLSTQPMRGTPARGLMFFSGIPLLPPRARIRAATCLGFLELLVPSRNSLSSKARRFWSAMQTLTDVSNFSPLERHDNSMTYFQFPVYSILALPIAAATATAY